MLDIAYIIPCYNEEKTILPTIKGILHELRKSDYNYRLYVYDNNSTDQTREKIQKAVNLFPDKIIYRSESIQGKGAVIRSAFQDINARCYVMTDGDNTYDQSQLLDFINMILNQNYDMVIGHREGYSLENTKRFHDMGNRFMKTAINLLFKTQYTDVLSGFRAFSYAFIKTLPITAYGFTIETEMCIHAAKHHMHINTIPIVYKDRENGESKINTIPDGVKLIYKTIYLYQCYKPLAFYGILSLIPGITGTGLFIPIFIEFIKTGLVKRFPTLFVCGFMILLAILLFFTGLTQYTNQIRHDQIFENIFCYHKSKIGDSYERQNLERPE